jgi:hypothetical protein
MGTLIVFGLEHVFGLTHRGHDKRTLLPPINVYIAAAKCYNEKRIAVRKT